MTVRNPRTGGPSTNLWSSKLATYLGVIGAAVGLGSIWRFPYLAGTGGGFAFIAVFVAACAAIATPLLVAEYVVGRWSRASPPEAAGTIAARFGKSRAWNAIGTFGTIAVYLIVGSYTMVAGWVLAYTWRTATGALAALTPESAAAEFRRLIGNPIEAASWHLAFVLVVAAISATGVSKGVELVSKLRAPAFLAILLGLVVFALVKGDVAAGLDFAFRPDLSKLTGAVALSAVGQAFYATGVGLAMMIAYGAYVPREVSLVRSALSVTGSIVAVSLLASLLVFPLVFRYGMNPAQGPALVFEVLPAAFAEMPGGRLVGTLFFVLLALAALTPSIAALEPVVAWLASRFALGRKAAVAISAAGAWLLGVGALLSLGAWSGWKPLAAIPLFAQMTFFDLLDFVSSNILPPVGALLTCLFVGWVVADRIPDEELGALSPVTRRAIFFSLRWLSPIALAGILLAALI